MVFLRINGWTVPVADGSVRYNPVDIGEDTRAFDGTLLTDRRARKREWQAETNQLTEIVAKAIEGSVAGLGDVIPGNWANVYNSTEDFFTAKGVARTTSTSGTSGAHRFGIAADGASVVDSAGNTESKFGNASMGFEAGNGAFHNILSGNSTADNIRTATDELGTTSGFAAFGTASLASENLGFRVRGARSLKVTPTGVGAGFMTSGVTASASTDYAGSVYIRTASDQSITVSLRNQAGTLVGSAQTLACIAGQWHRFEVAGNTPGGTTSISIRATNGSSGVVFYADALQIEANTHATTWANPGRDASPAACRYINLHKGATDITVMTWVKLPSATHTSDQQLVQLTMSGSGLENYAFLLRPSGTSTLRLETREPDGMTMPNLDYAATWDGDWHHVAFVLRQDPETGEAKRTIYFDGAAVASDNPSGDLPRWDIDQPNRAAADNTFRDETHTFLGGFAASNNLEFGLLDDVAVFPWAMPAAQIAAIYNLGAALPQLPRCFVDGDIAPDPTNSIECRGSVTASYVVAQLGGAQRSNNRKVGFSLREA